LTFWGSILIRIFNGANVTIGTLSFDRKDNVFFFDYHADFKGFPYGDVDCREAREFKSDSMFSIFGFEDCWNRQKIAEKYNLKDADDNESQWFILKLFAQTKQCLRGMQYEILEGSVCKT